MVLEGAEIRVLLSKKKHVRRLKRDVNAVSKRLVPTAAQ
jgi:hypothetical protein